MPKRFVSLMLALLLVLGAFSAALAAKMQEGSMYVNTANGKALRFRSSKNTDSGNILREIPYGTKVYVLDWDGTWARVRYDGVVGYVNKNYLTIARPLPHATVVAMREAEKAAQKAAREAARQQAILKKAEDAAAREAAKEQAAQKKAEEAAAREAEQEAARLQAAMLKAEEEAAQKAANRLRIENAKLDQSTVKTIDPYDVTVRVGVVDLGVNVYERANLTSPVLTEYMDGVRLVVLGQNKDWALVYNGSSDSTGYMLRKDLEEDIVEDVLLED